MGCGQSREIAELRLELENVIQNQKEEKEKRNGIYWHTINDVWTPEEHAFKGCYEKAWSLRRDGRNVQLYCESFLPVFKLKVETINRDPNVGPKKQIDLFIGRKDKFEELQKTLRSEGFISTESESVALDHAFTRSGSGSNRKTDKKIEDAYCKDFVGGELSGSFSRAHCFPKDPVCLKYWWPIFLVVAGVPDATYSSPLSSSENTPRSKIKMNGDLLQPMSSLRINQITFPGSHAGIFDTLKSGCCCIIPIFDSMADMASWQYRQPYKVLFVCDSFKTYKEIRCDLNSESDHIEPADPDDIRKATLILQETMKVLADSLLRHWPAFYEKLDHSGDTNRFTMLQGMKEILVNDGGKVKVPTLNQLHNAKFKLYTADYGKLYNDADNKKRDIERQFIPEPFSTAVKAAINLSSVFYKDKGDCKLLTACAKSFDDDSDDDGLNFISDTGSAYTINEYLDNVMLRKETENKLVGLNLHLPVVSDDEGSHNEKLNYQDDDSVESDLTYGSASDVSPSQF